MTETAPPSNNPYVRACWTVNNAFARRLFLILQQCNAIIPVLNQPEFH